MNSLEAVLTAYWAIMSAGSVLVLIYRTPLARWLRPQMRYWRNRVDAQRLHERSLLFGAIGIGIFSIIALYVNLVVMPRLERTLADIKATSGPPRPAAFGDPI